MSTDDPSNRAEGKFAGAAPERAWSDELERRRVPGPRSAAHKTVDPSMADATKCVHSGTFEDPSIGPVTTPIFQTSTFSFSPDTYTAFAEGSTRDVQVYTRYGNPTQWSVQEKIAALEGAQSSLVFASGMAAIFTTLLALTNRGGHILSSRDLYGGTYSLLREDMHQMGREVSFVDTADIGAVEAAIEPNTQLLYFETLTNPLLKAAPLRELVAVARKHRLLVVLDNTFVSPIFLKPVGEGVDVVLHSCTKYLNGHSDVVAGVASGSRKYVDRIWAQHIKVGGQLDPLVCFLLERGLKTLELRMQRARDNASALVKMLVEHPRVAAVHHPEVDGYPYRWVHEYCQGGYGGMVGFEVVGGDSAALALLDRLRIPAVATSLGGVESLVSLPFNTSHSMLTQAQREQVGIRPGLVRLSVGIEDPEDLAADLRQALDSLGREG